MDPCLRVKRRPPLLSFPLVPLPPAFTSLWRATLRCYPTRWQLPLSLLRVTHLWLVSHCFRPRCCSLDVFGPASSVKNASYPPILQHPPTRLSISVRVLPVSFKFLSQFTTQFTKRMHAISHSQTTKLPCQRPNRVQNVSLHICLHHHHTLSL